MPRTGTAARGTFVVLLRITVDDCANDDPRLWPFDDLLAPPEGESGRFVSYVYGAKEEAS